MIEIIGALLVFIVIMKLSLLAIKLFGKILGAIIGFVGYLVLGGVVITLSLPVLFIMVLVVAGFVSIISVLFVA